MAHSAHTCYLCLCRLCVDSMWAAPHRLSLPHLSALHCAQLVSGQTPVLVQGSTWLTRAALQRASLHLTWPHYAPLVKGHEVCQGQFC